MSSLGGGNKKLMGNQGAFRGLAISANRRFFVSGPPAAKGADIAGRLSLRWRRWSGRFFQTQIRHAMFCKLGEAKKALDLDFWGKKCSNLRLGSISRESESQIRESGQTWLAGWTPHWGAWEELLPLLSARVLVFPQITCMGWKHPIKAFQYSWRSSVCHSAVSPLPRSVWV